LWSGLPVVLLIIVILAPLVSNLADAYYVTDYAKFHGFKYRNSVYGSASVTLTVTIGPSMLRKVQGTVSVSYQASYTSNGIPAILIYEGAVVHRRLTWYPGGWYDKLIGGGFGRDIDSVVNNCGISIGCPRQFYIDHSWAWYEYIIPSSGQWIFEAEYHYLIKLDIVAWPDSTVYHGDHSMYAAEPTEVRG